MIETGSTKQIIDEYYSTNYNKIKKISRNILATIHKEEYADTLVIDSYNYLIDKVDKVKDKVDNHQFEAIIVNYINMQVKWNKTNLKKVFIDEDYKLLSIDDYDYDDINPEHIIDESSDIIEYKIKNESKYNYLEQRYINLDQPTKILYDLTISGPYNATALAKHIGVTRGTTSNIIKKLKNDLRNGYDDRINY